MTARPLPSLPPLPGLYARVVADALPLVSRRADSTGAGLPALRVEGVVIDPRHLASYRAVCGFAPGGGVPPTYPQAIAFPLMLRLMTEPGFPFGALGALHVGNRIVCARAPLAEDRLDFHVAAQAVRPHPRGTAVTVSLSAAAAGEPIWRAEIDLLRRGRPPESLLAEDRPAADHPDAPPTGPQRWLLSGDIGRRYARLSGDRNPIHLAALAAKPFGFARPIAHGMWTHARALAELENRLPDSYEVAVAFKRPVPLPGAVFFGARFGDDCIDFGVASAAMDADAGATPHLLGRIRPH
jgi:hypothetical protein